MPKEGEGIKDDLSSSNDDIVDRLVQDFRSSCETNVTDPGEPAPDKTYSGPSDPLEPEPLLESSQEKREDFIDEELLKQTQLSLSEQEKLKLRSEAEELKQRGNTLFKNNEYKGSKDCYTLALRTCPLAYPKERAILYANRAAAKINLNEDEPALEDCSKAIELDPSYVRALLRRAQLQESMDRLDEALEDFKKLLELDPANKDVISACQRLPPLIDERNEKMKTEMLGKLKDLGNVLLRPFGLSTDNFKMVQDPNTGGYSVNFQQNS